MRRAAPAPTELVPPPAHGRVFERAVRPALADAAPGGRVRLDALARWLQDAAYDDIADAGLAGHSSWVVRRTRLAVARFPRFGERLSCRTFCSGLGRMWAERRTTILRAEGGQADVEAVALWIHIDARAGRPVPLDDAATAIFRATAGDRRVRARLRHQPPDEDALARTWRFRRTDVDVGGHVNNAAYWEPLEDELLAGSEPATIDAEIEYRAPAQPGDKLVLSAGQQRWIAAVGPTPQLHASLVLAAL
jgi:acyl-ACP thioesterase